MDRGAWQATVYGVTQSQTRLNMKCVLASLPRAVRHSSPNPTLPNASKMVGSGRGLLSWWQSVGIYHALFSKVTLGLALGSRSYGPQ